MQLFDTHGPLDMLNGIVAFWAAEVSLWQSIWELAGPGRAHGGCFGG